MIESFYAAYALIGYSRFVHTQIGKIGHDWNQKHMKKIEKIFIENQIFDTSMQRLMD